ncbi:heat shock factor-binding protein 1 [Biomphalaria glabrata]
MRNSFVDFNSKMADIDKYGADAKNVQDLTAFVQTLLHQMQEKFQNMSDQIINRNILLNDAMLHILGFHNREDHTI